MPGGRGVLVKMLSCGVDGTDKEIKLVDTGVFAEEVSPGTWQEEAGFVGGSSGSGDEVDITNPSLNELPVYTRLGVPEGWRYNGQWLEIRRLEGGR